MIDLRDDAAGDLDGDDAFPCVIDLSELE